MPAFAERQNRTQSSNLVSTAKPGRAISNPARDENPILAVQETLGNQAMQHLLHAGVIQAKLKISEPNDKYEQEADRVADEVMRMSEPRGTDQTSQTGLNIGPYIQRVCTECRRGYNCRQLRKRRNKFRPKRFQDTALTSPRGCNGRTAASEALAPVSMK